MSEKTILRHADPAIDADVGDPRPNSDTKKRAERLRDAVRRAGGNKVVAKAAGIPKTTLDGYLAGGEMRLSNAVALASVTGVSLEWLACGEGHMRPPPPAAAPPPPPEKPFRLFGNVKIDRLVDAYEGALASAHGDRRLTMHLTVLLYDKLAELAENKA
jgi:hypothetical protein